MNRQVEVRTPAGSGSTARDMNALDYHSLVIVGVSTLALAIACQHGARKSQQLALRRQAEHRQPHDERDDVERVVLRQVGQPEERLAPQLDRVLEHEEERQEHRASRASLAFRAYLAFQFLDTPVVLVFL